MISGGWIYDKRGDGCYVMSVKKVISGVKEIISEGQADDFVIDGIGISGTQT